MDEQLTFDGAPVAYPLPRPRHLTERQRDLWLWAATTTPNGFTTADAGRFFADPSGALRRLESFGRVRRLARGLWATTT
jgi:hypothetical protein